MSNPCRLIIIVAMARNGVIGKGNKLPWHLPSDLKRFKSLTLGHTVVMGRKTFESLPNGPLPGRHNVVLTRKQIAPADNLSVVHSAEEVLKLAGTNTLYIIGGGEVYHQFLPLVCRLELTVIDADFEGDTFFPVVDSAQWKVVAEQPFTDEKSGLRGWYRSLERL
ncbi:MAG: dihydrofolate reductase [Bacteroidetes bacterium]|nr:dihydrofolate reductase [Bacteroidota bacterium]